MEDDVVIVPNIPMLSATSQSKHAARFLRLAMASIMDILKIKPFVEVSVGQLLWGYEDPLLKLAKDVVPKEQKLPYDEFGLFYGKNSTSTDRVTMFTGVDDITQYGIIDKYNGRSHMTNWLREDCNRLNGSDGSIFPPHIQKDTTLYVYEKDLCRLLPLNFEKEVNIAQCRLPLKRLSPILSNHFRLKDAVAFPAIVSHHRPRSSHRLRKIPTTCAIARVDHLVLLTECSMFHCANTVSFCNPKCDFSLSFCIPNRLSSSHQLPSFLHGRRQLAYSR